MIANFMCIYIYTYTYDISVGLPETGQKSFSPKADHVWSQKPFAALLLIVVLLVALLPASFLGLYSVLFGSLNDWNPYEKAT